MLVAIGGFLSGRIRFSRRHYGKRLVTDDGESFTIFRHMTKRAPPAPTTALFVVRFKFARFSHATNRWLSLIPVLLIAGYPGFRDKVWLVNEETEYWQGIYQWESTEAAEVYGRSHVLGIMNRRARPESGVSQGMPGTALRDFLDSCS